MMTNYTIYKSLREFTNDDLISYLHNNMSSEVSLLTSVLSEILRRLDESPNILKEQKEFL